MKQVKRLIYIVLLNIIISASTVIVVLKVWERAHPPISPDTTPVVIVVTPTNHPVSLLPSTNQINPGESTPIGAVTAITGTLQATSGPEMLVYQVKKGDTLGALAVEFNVSLSDLMTVNGLTDPDSLYEGQIIHIPTAPLPTITPSVTPTAPPSTTPRPSATATHGPTPTASQTQPMQEPQLVISTVIGAGVLANERVVLQRTGDGELSLAGWRLEDGKGNTYTFPQLTLYKGGSINLNTRIGENTVLDLYWGKTTTVWKSGKTVSVYDAQDMLRASYTIP